MSEIKKLTEVDNDEIFALSQFAFQYELSEEAKLKKQEEAKRHIIWGSMAANQLEAKLHLIPLSCYINGKAFEMGGISAVATWPEYRRKGNVKNLLLHALKHMKEHGQTVSFLHPFSFSFYRKYGWELAFVEQSYEIPLDKLKRDWEGNGYVRRVHNEAPVLHTIYTEYAKQFNGPLVRDEKWWEQRVFNEKYNSAVAYDNQDQPEAYIIYNVKENVVNVEEMAYQSINGLKLLLQFIANHDSMADKVKMIVPENDNLALLLNEPKFDQKKTPYFMARIVDVPEFLKQYSFHIDGVESLVLHVEDAFLPENTGTYQLTQHGKETVVTVMQTSDNLDGINCSIQQLSSILLGYKRPLEYYHLGLLRGELKQVEQLEKIVPQRQTFLPDFF
ncbi:GNAT family N-acetyltransferase [Virgibacillus sp. DJP39]|uniref:GNAT family N-acetyltransferase n=1 Tax=Virgibacillus sp. DJP39 TaxID=3409790 RepID=UPI003BB7464A